MNSMMYEFFMSQISHVRDIKETEKMKIEEVYHNTLKIPCILKVCKNRDLTKVCQKLKVIKHPNVAVLYDFVYFEGDTYIIEEFVTGSTVQEILEEKGPFSAKEAIRIIFDVCCGLECFHDQNPPLIHNDIKSSNIKIREDGSVKLFDFDVSRIYKEGATKNTKLFGTEEYAAPEHYGFGQSDPRTDIYSLGVTMHEMLTGEVLSAEHQTSYRGKCDRIIKKCIEIDPKKRYKSVKQLKRDLKKERQSKKKFFLWLAAVCVVVGVLFGSADILIDKLGINSGSTNGSEEVDSLSTDTEGTVSSTVGLATLDWSESIAEELEGTEDSKLSSSAGSSDQTEHGNTTEVEMETEAKQQKMGIAYQAQGTIESVISRDHGIYVILEKLGTQFMIKDSEGTEVMLEKILGKKGVKLIYDPYSERMYLLDIFEREIVIYFLSADYELQEVSKIKSYQGWDISHLPASFFSDGVLYFNNAFIGNKFLTELGYTHTSILYVIDDRLFEVDSNGFYEVDSRGNIIKKYPLERVSVEFTKTESIYVSGSYAYFLGWIEGGEYGKNKLYRFDGSAYEEIACLNDYLYYSDFDASYLCVASDSFWCYDSESKTIREFTFE